MNTGPLLNLKIIIPEKENHPKLWNQPNALS